MIIRVVIPWRGDATDRVANLCRVLSWWTLNHPTWPVAIGEWPVERGPWRKGCAVDAAGRPDDDDIVIVSDADVVCPQVGEAVDAVAGGQFRWAVAHRMVHRLSESATSLINGRQLDLPPRTQRTSPYVDESYVGSPGGGMVVVHGRTLAEVPIDPRFEGYGSEDHSWSLALHRVAGAPYRGHGDLWHLRHEPQARAYAGQSAARGIGSPDNLRLWTRYRTATTPGAMAELIAEARGEIRRLRHPPDPCATTSDADG